VADDDSATLADHLFDRSRADEVSGTAGMCQGDVRCASRPTIEYGWIRDAHRALQKLPWPYSDLVLFVFEGTALDVYRLTQPIDGQNLATSF
jgi:hypothetical protein